MAQADKAAKPVADYVISAHADDEMKRRGIGAELVRLVLTAPGQRLPVRAGRDVLQSQLELGDPPKTSLLRVFVDVDRSPAEVVTVYKTSRIDRYWQEEP